MSSNSDDVIGAFWNAMEKPVGYTKKAGFLPAGVRDTVVRGEGGVAYLLWGNTIATLKDGLLTLNDCGWRTVTTMDRLYGILAGAPYSRVSRFRVQKEKGIWYLVHSSTGKKYEWNGGARIALKRPMLLLKPIKDKEIAKRGKEANERIRIFLKEMESRIAEGRLADGGGECWGISMGIQKCEECQYLARTNCGGGVRLINKALEEKGYGCPAIFFCRSDENGKGTPDAGVMEKNWDRISDALRGFLKKKLALAQHKRREALAA